MGFDIYGKSPKGANGEYFRNNVWFWRPLWAYVESNCSDILSQIDSEQGHFNSGHFINAEKAEKIGQRLNDLVASGETAEFQKAYTEEQEVLDLVECDICKGKGVRDDEYVKGKCNACEGKGKRKDWSTNYPFEVENVKEFAEFCLNSGGFEIY